MVEPDEWYVLIGPDTDDFDLAGLWDEHNPSRHGAWECWMETADDGCLIVHLLAPCP